MSRSYKDYKKTGIEVNKGRIQPYTVWLSGEILCFERTLVDAIRILAQKFGMSFDDYAKIAKVWYKGEDYSQAV